MTNTFEKILQYKLMPRLMMLVMTIMYIKVINWGMSLDDLSTQQSAMISVVSGVLIRMLDDSSL